MPMQLVNSYYGVLLKRNRRTEIEKVLKDYPKLKDDYQKPASSTGELIAIFEVGTIAPKETSEHFIPIAGQLIRFSFPRIAYTSGFVGKTGVDIIGPKKMEVAGEQVQNLSKIAYYNLEERATRTALKATARIVAKGVAVGAVHRRYGALAGLAANLLAAASETADTRGWNLLPGYYYLVRQTLPAGNYKLKPFINNEDGKTQEVVIKSGQFSFVRFK